MTAKRVFAMVAMLAVLAGTCSVGGCSGENRAKNVTRDPSQASILSTLYGQYRKTHGGKNPPDEKTFKAYVKEAMAKGLNLPQRIKVPSDPESLFVSEGDGKPFVILYGPNALSGPKEGPGGLAVVIYEQEGVGGKRFVASPLSVNEVNEERFVQLVPKGGSSQ